MNNKEEWRPVKGYEGYYEVSSLGNVRSLTRKIKDKNGKERTVYGRYLSVALNKGYPQVVLSKDNKQNTCRVHRLVAETFIPNPLTLPEVNHKDENPQNNAVSNLEWCNEKYNCNYGNHVINIQKNRNKASFVRNKSKSIVKLTLEGDYVKRYNSIKEATSDTGLTNIGNALSGRYIHTGGYCWVYQDEYEKYFKPYQ